MIKWKSPHSIVFPPPDEDADVVIAVAAFITAPTRVSIRTLEVSNSAQVNFTFTNGNRFHTVRVSRRISIYRDRDI